MVAAAHSVTLDTGRASPFFAINDRHSVEVTAESGRCTVAQTAEREGCGKPTGKRAKETKWDGFARRVEAAK